MKITIVSTQWNAFWNKFDSSYASTARKGKQPMARNMASILFYGTAVFWWSMHVCYIHNRLTYITLWEKFSVIPFTK